jgi:hypothetical protein
MREIQGNEQEGIIYTLTHEDERGEVAQYHRKPSPLFKNKSKFKVDVKGLKPKELVNFEFCPIYGDIESRFSIGFEIEKNDLHRNSIREYELFCGFERDGSCGFEAVTHILPLLPPSQWRTKVFDMFHKAEHIIDDNWSPSSGKSDGQYTCGGHINLSCKGMEGSVLKDTIRPYSGILLALYRYRLNNSFCGHNRRMQDGNNWDTKYNSCRYGYPAQDNGWHNKYQMCLVKHNIVEWRLPSKVESVHQMMRRYELMYELMDFSINVKGTRAAFLKRIKPIVLSMMDGCEIKTEKILVYARHFQTLINTGRVHADIKKFL